MHKIIMALGALVVLSGCGPSELDSSRPIQKHAIEHCKRIGGIKLTMFTEIATKFYCYDSNDKLVDEWFYFKYEREAYAQKIN